VKQLYFKAGLKEDVKNLSSEIYEREFEFPFWKLVKQRAEEKDISYSDAAAEVCPEYSKTLRIRDTEWSDEQIAKWEKGGVPEIKSSEILNSR